MTYTGTKVLDEISKLAFLGERGKKNENITNHITMVQHHNGKSVMYTIGQLVLVRRVQKFFNAIVMPAIIKFLTSRLTFDKNM